MFNKFNSLRKNNLTLRYLQSKRLCSSCTFNNNWFSRIQNRFTNRRNEWKKGFQNVFKGAKDPTYFILNFSLLIGFIGSCIPDELYLRYFAVFGSSGAIIFNTHAFHRINPTPNVTLVLWDVIRIIAHSFNITRIWHERAGVVFSDEDAKIYAEHFIDYGFLPRQFCNIIQNSTRKVYQPGK